MTIIERIIALLIPERAVILIDESGDALFTEANPGEVTSA